MTDYDAIKLSLEKNGELMICLDTGDKIELHKHNTIFEDSRKELVIDAGTETIWISADKISYYKIHREGFKKE